MLRRYKRETPNTGTQKKNRQKWRDDRGVDKQSWVAPPEPNRPMR